MTDDKPAAANGWNEYSKLVLKELETLADNMDALRVEMQEVRRDIAKLEIRESKVDEINVWKTKMSEVVSPDQLKELIKEHKENRDFSIRAVTIFGIIQFLMAGTLVWVKLA